MATMCSISKNGRVFLCIMYKKRPVFSITEIEFDKFLTMMFLLHFRTNYAMIILKLKPGLEVHNVSLGGFV